MLGVSLAYGEGVRVRLPSKERPAWVSCQRAWIVEVAQLGDKNLRFKDRRADCWG